MSVRLRFEFPVDSIRPSQSTYLSNKSVTLTLQHECGSFDWDECLCKARGGVSRDATDFLFIISSITSLNRSGLMLVHRLVLEKKILIMETTKKIKKRLQQVADAAKVIA